MYSLTWITPSRKLETISSPKRSSIIAIYAMMRSQGKAARLWRDGRQVF